ncbi:alkaline phosphatase [Leptothrix ochracea]|uniref:alkaline phosphatase D family protein n=1 Tax=Leptothrix ochracea TaxID=735331 RepID=UPI0034E2064A
MQLDVLSPLNAQRRDGLLKLASLGASLGLCALAGCAAPAVVRHVGDNETDHFALGVASGSPRPDRLVLWTRLMGDALPPAVEVEWEVATDAAFKQRVAHGIDNAIAAWAHSIHAEPRGLAPGRWYFYRFHALGQTSPVGRTRTAPAPEARAELDFVIASCQRWDHGHYAAWRHVAEENLDLVLFLGDYIYESAPVASRVRMHEGQGAARTLLQYRARYAQYKSDPALQAAHACAPWIVTWDDHEVDNDYAGEVSMMGDTHFLARRAAAYQAYWEHQPLPKVLRPTGASMQLYERYDWGALARIHTLDDRQYRDPQACPRPGRRGGSNTVLARDCAAIDQPQRSLLGAAQEHWLSEGWSLDRPWNLLAQQTLMARWTQRNPTDPGGRSVWTDGWDGYPAARRRLLGEVAERKVPGCVVLGGDVHATYVADLRPDFDAPRSPVVATEFCGTSITSEGLAQAKVDAALPFNPHVRYARSDERGYVRFHLGERSVEAQIRSVHNVLDPESNIRTAARFTVASDRPGAQPV